MTERWHYDIRCCECGRFVKSTADRGAAWGNSYMMEPPDEEWFCEECAQRNIDSFLRMGRVLRAWWIPPNFVAVAKSILRHGRKVGEV